jgi:hypothetical protein
MSINGTSIYKAIGFASQVYQECHTLADVLTQSLSGLLNEPEINSQYKVAEKKPRPSLRWQTDEGVYLYHSLAASLPLTRGEDPASELYLFFQISLAGVGMSADQNQEPLLHLGLWEDEIDFVEGPYMGFPLTELHDVEDNVLLRWDQQWLYSLRLFSINNSTDIETKIIGPIRQLLIGGTAKQALPETLEGLARYIRATDLDDQYNYRLTFQEVSRI